MQRPQRARQVIGQRPLEEEPPLRDEPEAAGRWRARGIADCSQRKRRGEVGLLLQWLRAPR
eukprot:5700883-Alexandrium_andersonii.AAC.1